MQITGLTIEVREVATDRPDVLRLEIGKWAVSAPTIVAAPPRCRVVAFLPGGEVKYS
jgi:hypothetical protein